MKTTAQLWGNSLGIRIPATVARDARLTPGSEVDLQFEDGRIVLIPRRRTRKIKLKELLAGVTPANLPSRDGWGAPVGKEVW